jgi:ParB-like chromosome segregation protein Spo0J
MSEPAKVEGMLRIEYLPLSKLLHWPRNPKGHDLGTLHESFRRFGFVNPIILDEKTGRLVAGHGRLDTLQQAKATGASPPARIAVKDNEWLVPVIRGIEFADIQEAEAYLISDNRTVELGGWEEQALAAILADHAASDRGLSAIGFDQDDLDAMLRRIAGENDQAHASGTGTGSGSAFTVVVELPSEEEQQRLHERLKREGFICKAVTN